MSMATDLAPISAAALGEHWFTLRLRTWKAVAKAVKESGVDQKVLADRIDMDPGQFSKVITGKKSNVTLRTLHNIARAANHRLRITLEPLANLSKPNYTYEDARRDRVEKELRLEKRTVGPVGDSWTTAKSDSVLVAA
jgi:transcriptional regulator with XRE-family HTH domain